MAGSVLMGEAATGIGTDGSIISSCIEGVGGRQGTRWAGGSIAGGRRGGTAPEVLVGGSCFSFTSRGAMMSGGGGGATSGGAMVAVFSFFTVMLVRGLARGRLLLDFFWRPACGFGVWTGVCPGGTIS